MATKPQFKAALKDDTLELLVYEEIGVDWWTGAGVTAKGVKDAMDAAGAFSAIRVRINSPGGDAFEGAAIYSLLRAQGKPVNVFVDGIAASAASIIAMAGETITMSQVAMMMVHNAWTLCAGDAGDMRKCADTLDKVSGSIAQAYVLRTGKSAEEIKAIMDEETWMGAQDCVDAGFATDVASAGEAESAEAMALAGSFRALKKMRRVPERLKAPRADEGADVCGCPCDPCVNGECGDCTNEGCEYQDCDHGPSAAAASSNLSQYEARLLLLNAARHPVQ
jgi:ATP-dependent protease ClpP protease subunit